MDKELEWEKRRRLTLPEAEGEERQKGGGVEEDLSEKEEYEEQEEEEEEKQRKWPVVRQMGMSIIGIRQLLLSFSPSKFELLF